LFNLSRWNFPAAVFFWSDWGIRRISRAATARPIAACHAKALEAFCCGHIVQMTAKCRDFNLNRVSIF
jgi:hypothetical protein